MRRLCLCLLFTVSVSLSAQVGLINGAITPDLIPDSVAYRMVFLSLAEPSTASTEQVDRQHIKLSHLHLNQSDEQSLVTVLVLFQDQYTTMLDTFNKTFSSGQAPDTASLHAERDDLVQNTRNLLAAQLSSAGMLMLDTFVRGAKRNMKISGGTQ